MVCGTFQSYGAVVSERHAQFPISSEKQEFMVGEQLNSNIRRKNEIESVVVLLVGVDGISDDKRRVRALQPPNPADVPPFGAVAGFDGDNGVALPAFGLNRWPAVKAIAAEVVRISHAIHQQRRMDFALFACAELWCIVVAVARVVYYCAVADIDNKRVFAAVVMRELACVV